MNALRWALGLTIGTLTAGYVLLWMLSSAFRRSSGASENHPFLLVLPVIGAALLLGSILFPSHRPLLHASAVAGLGMAGFCVWQIVSESATILWLGMILIAAWFVFYGLAAWNIPSKP
jgi:hypothetical protein